MRINRIWMMLVVCALVIPPAGVAVAGGAVEDEEQAHSTGCESENDVRYDYSYNNTTGQYEGRIAPCNVEVAHPSGMTVFDLMGSGSGSSYTFPADKDLAFNGSANGSYVICPSYNFSSFNNTTGLNNLATCSSVVSATASMRPTADCTALDEVAGWRFASGSIGMQLNLNWGTSCLYPIYENISSNLTYPGVVVSHAFYDDPAGDSLNQFQYSGTGMIIEGMNAAQNSTILYNNSSIMSVHDGAGFDTVLPWNHSAPQFIDTMPFVRENITEGRWIKIRIAGFIHEPLFGGTVAILHEFYALDRVIGGIHDVDLGPGSSGNYSSLDRDFLAFYHLIVKDSNSTMEGYGPEAQNPCDQPYFDNFTDYQPWTDMYLAGKFNLLSAMPSYESHTIYRLNITEDTSVDCLSLGQTNVNFNLTALQTIEIIPLVSHQTIQPLVLVQNLFCNESSNHSVWNTPTDTVSTCWWGDVQLILGGGMNPGLDLNGTGYHFESDSATLYRLNFTLQINLTVDVLIQPTNAQGHPQGPPQENHYYASGLWSQQDILILVV